MTPPSSPPAGDATLRAVHDRLTAAVADLSSGEAWQRLLQTAAKFHHYSPSNVLLITAQCPQATAVAGFHTWRQLGRQVRQGERGIAILAPVLRRRPAASAPPLDLGSGPRDSDATAAASPGGSLAGFRVVHVFDLTQTDGPDLPAAPTPVELTGQAPDRLYAGLAEQVRDRGFQLLRRALASPHLGAGSANGVTDHRARTVIVDARLSDAQATKTLAHELGHVVLHAPGARPADLTRPRAEVEAESVAYVVTAAHGLDSGAYTVPYVTGWADGNLALLQQTAQRVLATAQTVLQRTRPPASPALGDRTPRTGIRPPARQTRPALPRAADRTSTRPAASRDEGRRAVGPDAQQPGLW